MIVIGIDLSGPSNHKYTVLTVFERQDGQLKFIKLLDNVSDLEILNEIYSLAQISEVVIGIDAPLSYQDGGGDRESDRLLRKFIISLGMRSGSIMTPTMTRMVYLTLRGIKLSREIERLQTTHPISMVEVHPGAIIGSRIAPENIEYVLKYKTSMLARSYIRQWLGMQNMVGLPLFIEEESHLIDSCAAALGVWHWSEPSIGPKWLFPANLPLHPYDFCC
ncbi:MAG: hypothetical protein K0Q73_9056 [Paenibacillus sp.]|nr:hypothetical protein [Paenibacillus sp.]